MTAIELAPLATALTALGGDNHPAGAVVGVAASGESSLAAAGWAVRPDGDKPGVPMREETLLDVASVTKVATTLIVMRLVDAGALDIDAPVAPLLPGFASGEDRHLRATITTAHLLLHRAGIAPWWPLYCRTTEREQALDLAERMPLDAEPDTVWRYSDLGMMLVGRIIERATGASLPRAFDTLVARPLGLSRTQWGPVDPSRAAASSDGDAIEQRMIATGEPYAVQAIVSDFAGWRTSPTRGVANDGNTAHALEGVSGHAGLFAPVEELLRLIAAPLDETFVSAGVRARFLRSAEGAPAQAHGFRRLTLGEARVPMLGHPGFTGTFVATSLDRELTVAVAATRLHGVAGTPVSTDLIRDTTIAGALDALTEAAPSRPSTRKAYRA